MLKHNLQYHELAIIFGDSMLEQATASEYRSNNHHSTEGSPEWSDVDYTANMAMSSRRRGSSAEIVPCVVRSSHNNNNNNGNASPGKRRRKHRGIQSRVQNRLRVQAHPPPLPSNLLANIQSLENKVDDIRLRI